LHERGQFLGVYFTPHGHALGQIAAGHIQDDLGGWMLSRELVEFFGVPRSDHADNVYKISYGEVRKHDDVSRFTLTCGAGERQCRKNQRHPLHHHRLLLPWIMIGLSLSSKALIAKRQF